MPDTTEQSKEPFMKFIITYTPVMRFLGWLLMIAFSAGMGWKELIQKQTAATSANQVMQMDNAAAFRLEIREAIAAAHDDNRKSIDATANRTTVLETKWDEIDHRLSRIENKIDKLR